MIKELQKLLGKAGGVGAGLMLTLAVQAAPTLGPWIPFFKGIDRLSATNSKASTDFSGLMVANALRIDLHDSDIRVLTTPRITNYQANYRETAGMTVSRFAKVQGVQVAINGGFFDPSDYYLPEGTPMVVSGLLISGGQVVSPANGPTYAAALMIDGYNHAKIVPTNWPAIDTSGIETAISGDYPVLVGGVNIGRKYLNQGFVHDRNPRTAIGLSQDGQYLYLLAIDGRQQGYSVGAYDYETAGWLQLLGAYDGINMDGGGSTTMSYLDSTGTPRRLNRPSAVADSGRERTVGCHLGVFAKALPGFVNEVSVLPDDDAATITWSTTAPATTQVEWGLTTDLGQSTPLDTNSVTRHAVVLTGLKPGTGYYFRAVSVANGNRYASPDSFFTTANYLSTHVVIALTDSWKYTSDDVGESGWTLNDYDDSNWSGPGAALLWADTRSSGPDPEVQPKATELPIDAARGFPFFTYYFRTHFSIPTKTAGASLLFSGFIDDGAVIYLNGHEIYRLRMDDPPAPISNSTLATAYPCDGNATCRDEFNVEGELADYLVAGDNLLAVEVHNYNPNSADITFGLEMVHAQRLAVPATLKISAAGGSNTLSWTRGGFVLQSADALAGPWTDVTGPAVSSPFVTEATAAARFYRLRKY